MALLCDVCSKRIPDHVESEVWLRKSESEIAESGVSKEKWQLCPECANEVNWHIRNMAMQISEDSGKYGGLTSAEINELTK